MPGIASPNSCSPREIGIRSGLIALLIGSCGATASAQHPAHPVDFWWTGFYDREDPEADPTENGNTGDWFNHWEGNSIYVHPDDEEPTYFPPLAGDHLHITHHVGGLAPDNYNPPRTVTIDSLALDVAVDFNINANISGGRLDVSEIFVSNGPWGGLYPTPVFTGTELGAPQITVRSLYNPITFNGTKFDGLNVWFSGVDGLYTNINPVGGVATTKLAGVELNAIDLHVGDDWVSWAPPSTDSETFLLNVEGSTVDTWRLEVSVNPHTKVATEMRLSEGSEVTLHQYGLVGVEDIMDFDGYANLVVTDESRIDAQNAYLNIGETAEGRLQITENSEVHAETLNVGVWELGTVSIDQGSKLFTEEAFVGVFGGNEGTVNLESATSDASWETDDLTVGIFGTGYVYVRNGGVLKINGKGVLGENTSQRGVLSVIGEHAKLELSNTSTFTVGEHGTGELYLTQGAAVTHSGTIHVGGMSSGHGIVQLNTGSSTELESLMIGHQAGSSGEYLVEGGSTLKVTNMTTVGEHGEGMLEVRGGSTATTRHMAVAEADGSTGSAKIAGTGSSLTVEDDLLVGVHGAGLVRVENGASLDVDVRTIIGEHSRGDLEVADGGLATIVDLAVGEAAGSFGTVSITTAGSKLTATNNLLVGVHGSGAVHVENSASLEVNTLAAVGEHSVGELRVAGGSTASIAKLEVGKDAGSQGTVTVTDAGSLLTVDSDLLVGVHGNGMLSVRNDGALLASKAVIGEDAGGQLLVASGATAALGELAVGEAANGEGTTTVSGAGSVLNVQSHLLSGVHGLGQVNVENGGTLAVAGAEIILGEETDGHGVLTISTGGNLQFTGEILVGAFGSGVFALQTGAIYTAAELILGEEVSGNGDLNLQLDSHLQVTGELIVGAHGKGSLNLGNGAMLTTHETLLGEHLTAAALIEVGAESSWNTEELIVADSGVVNMTVATGARIDAHEIIVAQHVGSLVDLKIKDADTTVHTEGMFLGGSEMHSGGMAAATISDGAHVQVAHELIVWESASLEARSGGVTVGDQSMHAAAGTVRVNDHGTLAGLGTIEADVFNAGGHVAAGGHESTGTLRIDGDYTQQDHAALEIKLADGHHDALDVTGLMSLSGELVVSAIGGFVPSLGQIYSILDWGSIGGEFEHLELPELDHALIWDTSQLYVNGAIRVAALKPGDHNHDGNVNGADFLTWQRAPNVDALIDWQDNYGSTSTLASSSTSVPEPSSLLLAALVSFSWMSVQRRS